MAKKKNMIFYGKKGLHGVAMARIISEWVGHVSSPECIPSFTVNEPHSVGGDLS